MPPAATAAEAPSTAGASAAETVTAESENASNIIRRLSSPIFTASGFHRDHGGGSGDGEGDSDDDGDRELDLVEAEGDGAERIQRWWRSCLLASKRTKAALVARPAFARLLQLLDKVGYACSREYRCGKIFAVLVDKVWLYTYTRL